MELLDSFCVTCPYCGEAIDILVDYSVSSQQYIEDCSVCCRPMLIDIEYDDHKPLHVMVKREDD